MDEYLIYFKYGSGVYEGSSDGLGGGYGNGYIDSYTTRDAGDYLKENIRKSING
jgi:hypothetical protein